MAISYYLRCLDTGETVLLRGLRLSEDQKELSFNPGPFTPEEVNRGIVQFLIKNIGKAVTVIPGDDIDLIVPMVQYFDPRYKDMCFFGLELMPDFETYLDPEKNYDPFSFLRVQGLLSPMVIDCIDKTARHFDWTSTIDEIYQRMEDEELREKILSRFFWYKKKEKPETSNE